VADWN